MAARGRRFISGHNAQIGVNLPAVRTKTPLADRLWPKVVKGDGCWPFTGHRCRGLHGQILGENGRIIGAHRAAWIVTYGPIPAGMYVCHKCDNPPCCRPDHLFLGDAGVNNADRDAKGRRRDAPPRGEANANARVTAEQVREMRRLRAEGWIYAQLAERYGMTIASAQRICTRAVWKHVD
jgi:hypothetical protein